MLALQLFAISSAAGEDAGCFVQHTRQQLVQEASVTSAVPEALTGYNRQCQKCRCVGIIANREGISIDKCRARCQGNVGFTYFALLGSQTDCACCSDLHQNTRVVHGWSLYANLDWESPPAPPGYKLKCGPYCSCTSSGPIQSDVDINTCGRNCGTWAGFIFSPYPPQGGTDCRCCNNLVPASDVTTQWNLYEPSGGGITGDPHVTTLDGKHYLLLKEGTYNLWRFSGLETGFEAKKNLVDWQVYAHYSGHQSFTKALLLIDNTEGSALELTAQDCKWKARSGEDSWICW